MEDTLMLFRRDISELDPFSQRELFVSFRNLVFQSIHRILGDYYLTEDIIQEAFIKAMLRGPYTKHAKNISAWLLQVSRNTAYDFLRKYKKNECINMGEYPKNITTVDANNSIDMIIEVLIRNEIIVELINDLNSDYKKVIVLRYYKDLPIKEIARRYDLSESVVSKRLARARKKIAKLYLKKWE